MEILQLIEGCKARGAKYQKILYERFFGYALKTAFMYVYNYDRAVDITNDGFVKVFGSIERFNYEHGTYPERLLMAWIKRIVVNTAIDELRKNDMKWETSSLPDNIWEDVKDNQRADDKLLYKELVSQVKKLPPMYRTVFNMYVMDGYTHGEIAGRLGIALGTSKSNLSRARAMLQEIIESKEMTHSLAV